MARGFEGSYGVTVQSYASSLSESTGRLKRLLFFRFHAEPSPDGAWTTPNHGEFTRGSASLGRVTLSSPGPVSYPNGHQPRLHTFLRRVSTTSLMRYFSHASYLQRQSAALLALSRALDSKPRAYVAAERIGDAVAHERGHLHAARQQLLLLHLEQHLQ